MKALVLSVVFALTSVVNAVSGNNVKDFAYNTEMNEGRVKTETVFKVENRKYLHNHLQYNYAYNAEGLVSAKEVLKWNKENQRFEKQYCLNFSYDGTNINVEYAAWNSKMNAYADVKAKTVYQINAMGTNYQSYKWNKKDNSWNLTAEHSTQPEEIIRWLFSSCNIHPTHNAACTNQRNDRQMFIQQNCRAHQSEQRIEIDIVGSTNRTEIFQYDIPDGKANQ